MTDGVAVKMIRSEMKVARRHMSPGDLHDYYWGRFTGLALALALGTSDPKGSRGGCPDCHAALPGDGSCCDECGWVLASDGERKPT